jgi:hypothetical protein
MHVPTAIRILVAVVAGAAASAQAGPAIPPAVADEVAAFARRPAHEQEAGALHLQEQLAAIELPWVRALASCAAAADTPGKPRTSAFPRREPGRKAPKPAARVDDGLPASTSYVFGLGTIETDETAGANKAARDAAARKAELTAALLGVWPHADRAAAALLRELDADTSADRYAAFLDSWRNGDESFYEALDRTAGTKDSVFFYDAMLGDFTSTFAKGDDAIKGLKAAHDALHQAFLSYRQYRAFREAVAWSLVLPPDRPLPAHLQRYEQKTSGAYSLREQTQMVLAACDFDPRKVVELVKTSATPLPSPLWRTLYDPFPRWTDAFQQAQAKMIESAGSTDAFLLQAQQSLRAAADAIRAAAHAPHDERPQHPAPR